MNMIVKHIAKNMYEKKLRTFIMLVTIILSTMVLFIGLSLNDIINNTYRSMTNGTYGEGNIRVTKTTDEENPLFDAQDIDTKSSDINQRLDLIQTVGKSTWRDEDINVSLTGLDVDKASRMDVIHPINVSTDFTLKANDVIISSRTATHYDLDIDDTITVDINDQTHTYSIVAISEPRGLYNAEQEGILLITSLNHIRDIYETADAVSQVVLKVDDERIDHLVDTLQDTYTSFSVQPTSELDTVQRDEETFQTAVILAIVIMVMIGAYVIFSLSKTIIQDRMPVIGTFRSVGASKRIVNRILRMEFLFYGLTGAGIGILLAILLLPIAADSFNEYKAFGVKTMVTYNPIYLTLAVVFGTLFPIMGAMVQIYRTQKIPLKEIILQTPHTIQEKRMKSLYIGLFLLTGSLGLHFFNQQDTLLLAIGAVLLLFMAVVLLMPLILKGLSKLTHAALTPVQNGEAKLGIKNISDNKIVSNNVSMIIVVFLLLLMIGNTSGGIDQYIKNTVEQDFDVMLEEPEMDFKNYADINTIQGVSDSYMQPISQTNYEIDGEQDTFIVYGVDDIDVFDQFYAGATFKSDAKTTLSQIENGIIVDTYQAERYHLEIGDEISLTPLDEKGQPSHDKEVSVEVAGTMEAASLTTNRDIILMPLTFYNDHFVDLYSQIVVKTEEPNLAQTVKKNIKDRYTNTGLTVQTFDELLGSQKETVDTLIRGVLVIILLGLIIGLLGISNNLLVAFNERKKEYAVLYAVCMSRKQIINMLIYEMCMTFISVFVIGFIAGLGMNAVWSRLMYAVGLRIEFRFNFDLYFILSGAVLVLLAFATYIIIRKVTRLNVLNELRYE